MLTRRDTLRRLGIAGATLGVASGTASAGDWIDRRSHPRITGFWYVVSVHRENICYWAKSGCIYWTVASLADPIPGDAVAVGSGCAGSHAACRIPQDMERITGEQFTWIHVYDASWWNWTAQFMNMNLLIPEGLGR